MNITTRHQAAILLAATMTFGCTTSPPDGIGASESGGPASTGAGDSTGESGSTGSSGDETGSTGTEPGSTSENGSTGTSEGSTGDSSGDSTGGDELTCPDALIEQALTDGICPDQIAASDVQDLAFCVALELAVPPPPAGSIQGEAYQIAYQILCETYGDVDGGALYCSVSEILGCEGTN
jgi:hypothetical protein